MLFKLCSSIPLLPPAAVLPSTYGPSSALDPLLDPLQLVGLRHKMKVAQGNHPPFLAPSLDALLWFLESFPFLASSLGLALNLSLASLMSCVILLLHCSSWNFGGFLSSREIL